VVEAKEQTAAAQVHAKQQHPTADKESKKQQVAGMALGNPDWRQDFGVSFVKEVTTVGPFSGSDASDLLQCTCADLW
jgi:hypothetical protein